MRIHLGMWLLSSMLAAVAQASPVTQLESEVTYEVRTDATYTFEQFLRMRVDEAGGVRGLGQMPLPYSESLQALEVLEAYTTTRDGTRIDVTPDKIFDQQSPQSRGNAMFSDRKVKVVIFPQVEVGSITTVRFRRTQLKPDIPGFFSLWETSGGPVDRETESITLRAPATLTLHIDTREVDGGELANPSPGMREWRWTFKPVKGNRPSRARRILATTRRLSWLRLSRPTRNLPAPMPHALHRCRSLRRASSSWPTRSPRESRTSASRRRRYTNG